MNIGVSASEACLLHIALLTSIFLDITVCINFCLYKKKIEYFVIGSSHSVNIYSFNYGSILGLERFRGYFPAFLEVGYLYYESVVKPQLKKLSHETKKHEN